VSGQGPGRDCRGIGPLGLENLNGDQENDQCEKNPFHAGLIHREFSAIGKSPSFNPALIGNSS
jgi:hypothetical protein